MTKQKLTTDWIDRQLELCEKATLGPWRMGRDTRTYYVEGKAGFMVAKFVLPQNAKSIVAAREGYPLVLEQLQEAQGELRSVFSILEGLHFAIDAMAHENIKECLGQLLVAGSDWLEKEVFE